MSDQPTPDEADRVTRAIMAEVFGLTQPDRGDVFSWLDDHSHEVASAAIAAHAKPHRDIAEKLAEALRMIDQWANAYPVDRFQEPDLSAVNDALTAAGLRGEMDRMHASWARHLVQGVGNIAHQALAEWEASK